jgi:uncharacterized repeat protein (TIGR01451 family)
MKSPIVFVTLLCVVLTGAYAQQAQENVAVDFKGVSVAFHGNPQNTDAKLLPYIDGKSGKERFGICLGGASTAAKAIEIVDKDGLVLKSISVGELLTGKGAGLALISQPPTSSPSRWIEKKYAVDLPKGKIQLAVKALATGDASSDQHLIVTFALKSDAPASLALRAFLPISGSVEAVGKGFVLAPKSGSAAVAVSVYPGSASVTATKSLVTLSTKPASLDGFAETPLLWFVMDGVGGGSSGTAKAQASALLRQQRFGESDPRIVIVSSTDKQTTQPGDIVTYTLLCRNIGTGEATNVALSNPVSEGMQYLAGSATSDGCSLSFEPSSTSVRKISWKFNASIKPGEERQVSFKVQVK